MTKENLDIALELAFEMEGLISLMQKREDMTPPQVEVLLKRKAVEFVSIVAPDNEVACGDCCDNDAVLSSVSVESTDNNNEEISRSVVTEEVEDAVPQQPMQSVIAEDKNAISVEPVVSTQTIESACASPAPSAPSISEHRQIVFTINDRFRFRRELFDDDQEEFENTLLLISGMENMSEIEDYLYNDLCLDSNDDVVCDFVEALKSNFDGR